MSEMTVTIAGTEYAIADLPEAARQQCALLQFLDGQQARLQNELAAVQLARQNAVQLLMAQVGAPEPAPAKPRKAASRKKPA
ncbi:DUF6447 family protein [Chitinilyticum litopenaei]|uniref:DUF6447 family protein n=1 Tax=Chitinilyticum litopenaei TaxID=1121276 RepID=UPI000403CEA9|nr:DUF6447 family protein [Chitinilyticum litopenaei]